MYWVFEQLKNLHAVCVLCYHVSKLSDQVMLRFSLEHSPTIDKYFLHISAVHIYDPVNMNIRSNDTVTLQCVVTGGNGVAWRRNNQIIYTANSLGYSGGTVNTPSLTISNVTRYHSGNYTCETSYDLIKVSSKKTIQLYVKGNRVLLNKCFFRS